MVFPGPPTFPRLLRWGVIYLLVTSLNMLDAYREHSKGGLALAVPGETHTSPLVTLERFSERLDIV